jgi:nucleotide-binding universal stress UspA family protein
MFDRILVPLDLSDRAERALPHATTLARALDVPVVLLHVVDIAPLAQTSLLTLGVDDLTFTTALTLVEAEVDVAKEYLKLVGNRLAEEGVTPAFEVRRGLIEPELLAATRPGDLMVMASHGSTGPARWFVGSVTDAIVRNAAIPVLIVRSVPASEIAAEAGEESSRQSVAAVSRA